MLISWIMLKSSMRLKRLAANVLPNASLRAIHIMNPSDVFKHFAAHFCPVKEGVLS